MSDSAQKRWSMFEKYGFSVDDYSEIYPILAANKKKADIIAEMQDLGYSYSQAMTLYSYANKKIS
jgi:hypothetical protein